MLDPLRPLIGFRPRPYKIAKRVGGLERGRGRKRRVAKTWDREYGDDVGGDDDGGNGLFRAFTRTREIADL
jgi:hypothetical protein